MYEADDPFMAVDTEKPARLCIVGEPVCHPICAKPVSLGRQTQQHGRSATGQELLPLRNARMLLGSADHRHNQRCAAQARKLTVPRRRIQRSVTLIKPGGNMLPGQDAGIAAKHDEAPRFQATVIRNTRGNRQDRPQLVFVGCRFHQLGDGNRFPAPEELQRQFIHDQSVRLFPTCLEIPAKTGFDSPMRFHAPFHLICRRLLLAAGLVLFVGSSMGAQAQTAADLALPKLKLEQYVPSETLEQPVGIKTAKLRLSASLTAESPALTQGLAWRVFGAEPDANGKLPIIAKTNAATPEFDLAPGAYLVHAAFGRAGATKKILLSDDGKVDDFVLNAGGLRLNAILTGGAAIPPFKLKFDIYDLVENIDGERQLIIDNIKPGAIVGLNAGIYHVVSTYGALNAVIRSDIRVEAGKLTEATVEHRAAEAILKLVAEPGGEALADTAWTIYTELGEVLYEVVGPYAPVVLSEGTYTAVAKHRDSIIEKDFVVETGKNADVELLLSDTAPQRS